MLIPSWFFAVMSAVLGLIIGSFLNVVVARLPHRKSLIKPGSHCPQCQAAVRWWDNIPVLSYAWLGGKCRSCRTPISIRYPVIEMLTGLLFLTATLKYGFSPVMLVRDFPFLAILVAVTFIDLEHRIIPDPLSLGGMALGLATSFWATQITVMQSVLGAVFGFGMFYFFAWLYQRMAGRSGLGGGDIKLLGMLGAFLGPMGVFAAILISSVFGSLVGIGWALATRRQNMMTLAIPYGPFLVVGGLYYYLLGDILWLQFTIPT